MYPRHFELVAVWLLGSSLGDISGRLHEHLPMKNKSERIEWKMIFRYDVPRSKFFVMIF